MRKNRVTLQQLRLRHFKGVREFTLGAAGEDVSVLGDNASGKTTLADSFHWLLFGKDSAGRATFEIKSLDSQGKALHGLEHEVDAELTVGGRKTQLRKVFSEKWTKRRGSPRKEFTGHTTEHYVDGVPVRQAEYQERIAGICDESVFRLLTDPVHFSDRLHWQERRQILLQVCGDVSDEDVIDSERSLAELPEILGGRSIEDHRKIIQARRRDINRDLERLPVRIDEVTRSLPDLSEFDEKKIFKELATLRDKREETEAERSRIKAGGEIAERQKRLSEISARMLELETEARRKADDLRLSVQELWQQAQTEVSEARSRVEDLERREARAQEEIEALDARMVALREKWHEVDAEELEYAGDTVCHACGQDLPAEKVEAAHQRALEAHNAEKARRLAEITAQGKSLAQQKDELSASVVKLGRDLKKAVGELETLKGKAEKIKREIDTVPEFTLGPDHSKLAAERDAIERAMSALRNDTEPALQEVRERISGLNAVIAELEKRLQAADQRRQGEQRIQELTDEERRLAAEFEELEKQVFLTEEFVRVKVNLLEEKINSRFRLARFKLFQEQVNGGLSEVCEVTYNGVPYGTNLNAGARVQVGLDIIRTLQEHHQFAPPVWVDQGESVTSLPEMDCQLIRLVVSAADKTMRVEVGAKKEVAAS